MELQNDLNIEQLENAINQLPHEKKVSLMKRVFNSQKMLDEQCSKYQDLLNEIVQKNGKYDDALAEISLGVLSN